MLLDDAWEVPLTPRETEIVELIANGGSSKEVARLLGIAPATVERHVENARLKMRARNRSQMITRAIADGVLSIERGRATAAEPDQFKLPLNPGL